MIYTKSSIKYFIKKVEQKGFFHLLSANLLIQVFAFASQLFVAGILSPENIGRIKIIQTFFSVFLIIAGMGFNASTLKICSENRTYNENADYFNAALLFTLITSVVVYLSTLIINAFNLISHDELIHKILPLAMLPVISSSVLALYMAYFQSQKEVKLYSKLTIYNKLIAIIFIIVFTYYWGIFGYYTAFNISFVVLLVVSILKVKEKFKFSLNFDIRQKLKNHWEYAKANTLAYIVSELSAFIDIILISFLIKDIREIGFYSFALTLTIALKIFPSTVQQITIPYFSSFDLGRDKFLTIFKKYNRLLYLTVFISLILFLVIAPNLISFLFDGKYDNSYYYLIFLSIGWSIRNLIQLKSGAIFGLGKIKYNAYAGMWTLLSCLIVYPLFIGYWGIMGAAYASVVSGIIFFTSFSLYFRKAVKEHFNS